MLAETQARRVAIVGAGFIGLEMAENLRDLGLDVSIIEKAPQAMAPMDPKWQKWFIKNCCVMALT